MAKNHFSAATCTMFRPCGSGVSGAFSIYPASGPEYTEVERVLIGGIKVKGGCIEVPPSPGLGTELNEKALERFLTPGRKRILIGNKK